MVAEQFYNSTKWKKLLNVLKHERTKSDGLLYCEHCGEPMIKERDIIGHHIIELNENNINDCNITLNSDNIALIHHRCHNDIHNRFGQKKPLNRVFCVYGACCSGKTFYVQQTATHNDLIVDKSLIIKAINPLNSVQSKTFKDNVNLIYQTMLEMVKMRVGNWSNAYIVGDFPTIGERERLKQKYNCEFIFIDTSEKECLKRAKTKYQKQKVKEWFLYAK